MYNTPPSSDIAGLLIAAADPPARKPSGRRRHKHKPGDEALCKYASKACYNSRVVKKTGDLHRYCEHHRLQANRNQRRLEQRRRGRDRGEVSSGGDDASMSTISYSSDHSSSAASDSTDDMMGPSLQSNTHTSAVFEPFRYPVSLRDEDLSSLRSIFNDSPHQHQQQETRGSEPAFHYEL